MRIFYHLFDVTVVNSSILHKLIIAQNNGIRVNIEKPITSFAFKEDLAVSLCKVCQLTSKGTVSKERPIDATCR